MYSNGMRLHAQAGCVAITYRANYRGRSFRGYRCRSVAEPSTCPMDRCHQLHLVGHWCASCYGYSCYLFRAVDLVLIATSSSCRILFPSTRRTRSRCLRHYSMQLGKVSMQLLPRTGTLAPLAGQILYVVGFFVALIMWGFGLVWFFFAIASISHSKFPFNMGWWGFTFPIGVFTVATTTLGKEMPSRFFDILGTVRGQQGL